MPSSIGAWMPAFAGMTRCAQARNLPTRIGEEAFFKGGSGRISDRVEQIPLSPPLGFAHQFRFDLPFVIPAKAGIQKQRGEHTVWMPAFAGMTVAAWSRLNW